MVNKLSNILGCFLLIISFSISADEFSEARKAFKDGDYTKAIELYKVLANTGDANAQNSLGVVYDMLWWQTGKDSYKAEARKCYQLAAEGGDPGAQTNLGVIYEREEKYTEAFRLYKSAADKGVDMAQFALGEMYLNGKGTIQDYVEALKWLKLASNKGMLAAQYKLALFYEIGLGTTINHVKSYALSNIVAARDNDLAKDFRDKVGLTLTAKQLDQAQKLSRECLAKNYKNCDF